MYVAAQQSGKGFLLVYDLARKQLLDLIKVGGWGGGGGEKGACVRVFCLGVRWGGVGGRMVQGVREGGDADADRSQSRGGSCCCAT